MIEITCPDCGEQWTIELCADATYTVSCIFCGEPFSYRVVDGQFEEWHPPRIAGVRVYRERRKAQSGDFIQPKGRLTKTMPDGTQEVIPLTDIPD